MLELTPETVTLALPAVRVPDPVPVLPSSTLPKASVAGVTVSCPLVVVVKWAGPLLTPAHAVKRLRPAKRNSGPAFLQKLLEEICLFAIVIVVTGSLRPLVRYKRLQPQV